jgi:hypothetical protein
MRKILALLSLLLVAPLPAQEDAADPPSGIRLRAIAFSHFEEISRVELRREERILTGLELPTGQLRPPVSVTTRQFTCGIAAAESFRVLATITLPEAGRDFILVFAPTASGYRVFPVRADDPDFRGNDTLLFNFTPHRIGARLGTSLQVVDSMQSSLLRPGITDEDTFYQALFAYEKDGEYIPFNNTRWPVNTQTKALVFVHKDPATGEFTYRSVTERASP